MADSIIPFDADSAVAELLREAQIEYKGTVREYLSQLRESDQQKILAVAADYRQAAEKFSQITPDSTAALAAINASVLASIKVSVSNVKDIASQANLTGGLGTVRSVPAPSAVLTHDTGVSNTDGITNDPHLTVEFSKNDISYVVDGGVASSTYNVNGLSQGAHTVAVIGSLPKLNSATTTVRFVLDQMAPAALGVALKSNTGASRIDKVTNDATLVFEGHENGSLIEYYLDGKGWSSSPDTKDGVNEFLVRQVDAAGNASASTEVKFNLDTTAPAPTLTNVSTSGLIGTGEAGGLVTVKEDTTTLGTALVNTDGTWSFALTGLKDGPHTFTALQTDTAGNLGTSDSFAFALDYTPNQSLFGAVTHDVSSPGGEAYALYDALLGRTPDATGLEGWASALGHGASLHNVSLGFLVSNEFTANYGGAYTTGSDEAFVQYLYHEALGRAPDAQGEAGWDSILAAGGSRADVALKFALSAENQGQIAPALEAGVFVADPAASAVAHLYYGLLDRTPDAGGLQSYTAAVHDGLSLTRVAQNFLNSSEYTSQHTGPLTDQQYVDSLYTHALGRTADAGSEAFWLNALSHNSTRADVAIGIAESHEASLHLVTKVEAGWHLA